jgi:hypothetical protein
VKLQFRQGFAAIKLEVADDEIALRRNRVVLGVGRLDSFLELSGPAKNDGSNARQYIQ